MLNKIAKHDAPELEIAVGHRTLSDPISKMSDTKSTIPETPMTNLDIGKFDLVD